jgi:GYF domain 2
MRQFTFYIDNEVRGPHTEAEIQELINLGTVVADTPCMPEGATEWTPASQFFTFAAKIKLTKRLEANEEELALEANRLNPDDRRKLMMYGLSDSATVDQINQTQATVILAEHENNLNQINKRNKIIVGTIFTLALMTTLSLGLFTDLGGTLVGKVVSQFIKDDPELSKSTYRFTNETKRFQELYTEGQNVVFAKPLGGQPIQPTLNARLKIPATTGYKVSGKIDLKPLNEMLKRVSVKPDSEIKLYFLPSEIPAEISQKITDQAAVLETILSAVADMPTLEKIKSDLINSFPVETTLQESTALQTEIKNLKLNEIKGGIERIEYAAREATRLAQENEPKGGSLTVDANIRRQWAYNLRAYAGKLRDLENRYRININPNSRKKIWSEFNSGPGSELAAWILSTEAKLIPVSENGEFTIPECANLDKNSAANCLVVSTRVNGDSVFLAWGSKFLASQEIQSTPIPREVFLAREEYKVTTHTVTGDRPLVIKYRVGDRELSIRRNSPKWYFLNVAREKDPDSLVVLVTAELQEKYPVGTVIPYSVLLDLELFLRPTESSIPSPFTAAE